MDTSKTYIKMSDCPEIQNLWTPSNWDYTFCRRDRQVAVLSGYTTDGGYYGHQTPTSGMRDYYTGSCDDLSKDDYKSFHIWLPRQDQLQEMVLEGEGYNNLRHLLLSFVGFCDPQIVITHEGMLAYEECQDAKRRQAFEDRLLDGYKHQEYIKQFTSYEQLWLAFVMKENHNKVWDGERWKQ